MGKRQNYVKDQYNIKNIKMRKNIFTSDETKTNTVIKAVLLKMA